MQIVARLMRALGPALPAVHPVEALRAGVGAFIGLAVVGMLVLSPVVDLQTATPINAASVLPTTADHGCASGALGTANNSTALAPNGAIR